MAGEVGASRPRRAIVVTISDSVAAGSRRDESGAALADRLTELGFATDRWAVPDDRVAIERIVRGAAAAHQLAILTGGTGLTPRDVTPQAVMGALEYEIPGFGELMRARGAEATPYAWLSRSLAGVLHGCLVVAVPGSPRGALESLAAIEPLLDHALETIAGPFDHDAEAKTGR